MSVKASWPAKIYWFVPSLFIIEAYVYGSELRHYLSIFGGVFDRNGYNIGGDFLNYWAAAKIILKYHLLDIFDATRFQDLQHKLLDHDIIDPHNWSYPPLFLPWILWLGLMPYLVALSVWSASTFVAYLVAVAGRRPNPWVLSALVLASPASIENFVHGENGFLSGALIIGGLRLLDKRPVLAGLLFGCMSYKPQLALLIPVALIGGRQWRSLGAMIATTLGLVALSIFIFGMDPWIAYYDQVLPYQKIIMEADPQLMAKFLRMMPSVFVAARILGSSVTAAYDLAVIAALLSIGAVLYTFRSKAQADLKSAVLLTAIFLASPYTFNYDMPLLVGGLIALAAAIGGRLNFPQIGLLIFAWFLPLTLYYFNILGCPLAPFALALLLFLELHFVGREDQGRTPECRSQAAKVDP